MSSKIKKPSKLMLYEGKITVCSEIPTRHINALYWQNLELLNVKPLGT
jgi:hypothetical protein